jgi:hypothetical protein
MKEKILNNGRLFGTPLRLLWGLFGISSTLPRGTIWNPVEVTEGDYLRPFCGCLGEISWTFVELSRGTI